MSAATNSTRNTFTGRRIAFTGGGSAGHVFPLLPLIEETGEQGAEVRYFGSEAGIEKSIIESRGIAYVCLRTTKFRRSLSLHNAAIPWILSLGILDAFRALKQFSPDLLVSKGGFVSVPVVIAAWLLRIPVIAHESDLTPGLANRIALPFCTAMCTALPLEMLGKHVTPKHRYTGIPLRDQFFQAKQEPQLANDKPVLLVFGGSLGSTTINSALRRSLASLSNYKIIHICGIGNVIRSMNTDDYIQMEFAGDDMAMLMAKADVVLCRAGMTSILELLFLEKAAVLVPLGKAASRGDQIENAELFNKLKVFSTLPEASLEAMIVEKLRLALKNHAHTRHIIQKLDLEFGIAKWLQVLIDTVPQRGGHP